MKTMLIEEAVEYCKDKLVALHIPTQRIYNEAKKYAKEKSIEWSDDIHFAEHGSNTCIDIENNRVHYYKTSWCSENGYEVIKITNKLDDLKLIHKQQFLIFILNKIKKELCFIYFSFFICVIYVFYL